MIAIDTNVLVRYFVQDDPRQARLAVRLLEELSPANTGFISLVVLAELAWVLESRYRASALDVRTIVSGLLGAEGLVVEEPDLVQSALVNTTRDFADALIHEIGRQAGCERTVTFDRVFARASGVELLVE